MKTDQTNVERFYKWLKDMGNVHISNGPARAAGFHIVATHKIKGYAQN